MQTQRFCHHIFDAQSCFGVVSISWTQSKNISTFRNLYIPGNRFQVIVHVGMVSFMHDTLNWSFHSFNFTVEEENCSSKKSIRARREAQTLLLHFSSVGLVTPSELVTFNDSGYGYRRRGVPTLKIGSMSISPVWQLAVETAPHHKNAMALFFFLSFPVLFCLISQIGYPVLSELSP